MKITHCKLKKNVQRRLLEFFVLEVTARSAADFLSIQPNTAAFFYKKIRQVIVYHLALEAQEMFDRMIELDESYFGGHRKGKRGRGAAGKVARCGRAIPFLRGGLVRFIRDKPRELPVAMFSPRNIVKGSFKIDFVMPGDDTVDIVKVEFFNQRTWK